MTNYDVIIIGGGASGFFSAINLAKWRPDLSIAILEKAKTGLQKVKISGGGRCNVTHAEFIPRELSKNYPRGEKEVLGPFHTFMTGDTMEWFAQRGIELKIEDDGRIFPVTNSSQTIIDCFLQEAKQYGVNVLYSHLVKKIIQQNNFWQIETSQGSFIGKQVVFATGSSPKIWKILEELGLTIIPPVPSLFTFHCDDERIKDIPGVASDANVTLHHSNLKTSGPLLVTHWGFSGPAILKLSAFGAVELAQRDYQFSIFINFIQQNSEQCLAILMDQKEKNGKKIILSNALFGLPKRLWQNLCKASGITSSMNYADANKSTFNTLTNQLTQAQFRITGKSTFKEEFVTAGGVDLKAINFKTFECKEFKNLYIIGEALNVDAITGGFNFQHAWTSGYLAARAIIDK